jgi:hypothetical protein
VMAFQLTVFMDIAPSWRSAAANACATKRLIGGRSRGPLSCSHSPVGVCVRGREQFSVAVSCAAHRGGAVSAHSARRRRCVLAHFRFAYRPPSSRTWPADGNPSWTHRRSTRWMAAAGEHGRMHLRRK